jgi:hypothetical protein
MRLIKITFKVFGILALLALIAYFALQLFGWRIYKQRNCEWANIDNIELHTHTNIPDINECSCNYDKTLNTKKSTFDVNMEKVDIAEYIRKGEFKPVQSESFLNHFKTFQNDTINLEKMNEFYFKESNNKNEDWKILLNKTSGRLWIILHYPN